MNSTKYKDILIHYLSASAGKQNLVMQEKFCIGPLKLWFQLKPVVCIKVHKQRPKKQKMFYIKERYNIPQ